MYPWEYGSEEKEGTKKNKDTTEMKEKQDMSPHTHTIHKRKYTEEDATELFK